MSTEPESFLARWSRRKRAADEVKGPSEDAVAQPHGTTSAQSPGESLAPASGSAPPAKRESDASTEVPLPTIESLDGLRSDYQAFFQQPIAEELRHAALKKLFADPHFNQMDMLDVYVDDYTQFEPLPAAMKLRLPSARAFLSDSERAEVEAAETRTGDADVDAGAHAAAPDTSIDPMVGPPATTSAPTASDASADPLDASSSPSPSGQSDS